MTSREHADRTGAGQPRTRRAFSKWPPRAHARTRTATHSPVACVCGPETKPVACCLPANAQRGGSWGRGPAGEPNIRHSPKGPWRGPARPAGRSAAGLPSQRPAAGGDEGRRRPRPHPPVSQALVARAAGAIRRAGSVSQDARSGQELGLGSCLQPIPGKTSAEGRGGEGGRKAEEAKGECDPRGYGSLCGPIGIPPTDPL